MYSNEPRRVTGKKTNFSRDSQPYFFSNLPMESFELDTYSPQRIFVNENTKSFKIIFCIDVYSKYLFTQKVKSKSAQDTKNALQKIFQKIDTFQSKFPTKRHLKRICTGTINNFYNNLF